MAESKTPSAPQGATKMPDPAAAGRFVKTVAGGFLMQDRDFGRITDMASLEAALCEYLDVVQLRIALAHRRMRWRAGVDGERRGGGRVLDAAMHREAREVVDRQARPLTAAPAY